MSPQTDATNEDLFVRCTNAALWRVRRFQLGESGDVDGIDDRDLAEQSQLDGVCVTPIPLPTGMSQCDAAESGWAYEVDELSTSAGTLLRATMTTAVIEIAAASMTTRDPRLLVPYMTSFVAHVLVHNLGQGIGAPGDTHSLARLHSDGVADHRSRIVGLLAYGIDFEGVQLDLDDQVVRNVLNGTVLPMFRERARRRGREDVEHAERAPRRAWRDLGLRLIRHGLPADGVTVVAADGYVHVTIGGWVHSYRGVSLDDVPVLAFYDYLAYLDKGARTVERARLQIALDALRRVQR